MFDVFSFHVAHGFDYWYRQFLSQPYRRRFAARGGGRTHWPFEDRTGAGGTEEEILNSFRRVRDEMRRVFDAYAAGLRDAVVG